MRVTVWESIRSTTGTSFDLQWGVLARTLAQFRAHDGEKSALKAWSPTEGTSRGASNVRSVCCLVFDFDSGDSIEAMSQLLHERAGVIHTSWSHSLEHPKARVVLPLVEEVSGASWKVVYAAALRWAQDLGLSPDGACKDPSRLFYLAACRSDERSKHVGRISSGRLLDVRGLIKRYPPPPKPMKFTTVNYSRNTSEAVKAMETNPHSRQALAERLGARLNDGLARGISCPRCSRKEVWFPIERSGGWAQCNHQNSCGWNGPLRELAG